MSLTMDNVASAMGATTEQMESSLKSSIEGSGGEMSTRDMIKLQMEMNKYNMQVQLESNVMKSIADTTKAVVQNIRT